MQASRLLLAGLLAGLAGLAALAGGSFLTVKHRLFGKSSSKMLTLRSVFEGQVHID